MIKLNHLLFTILILFLISCQKSIIFEKYNKIPDYEWQYDNKVSFKFSLKDTSELYNLYLNLRHTGSYPYCNIWVMISQKSPDNKLSFSRYEFTLAAPDGRWLGKGLGDIVDHKIIFKENVKFSQAGEYTYLFQHDMRMDVLPSIMDIGISVVKQNN